ncbi:aspartyl-phosphate phosphatase Spo0E family protein [Garciella nitratireducens]|uniref:aspartyl-phosphate phosphatase Spo0E family protein n=1 Tax=Garciella nitratireducens TaxID=218205 RepID=UPI000DE964F7|nr:aspartyl-phosphate phosphatase Spo0E family protein [Garciella nitratireducens]RBP46799.1 Spo0E like sporulation regulatory protein [Garciella nitratireducens]
MEDRKKEIERLKSQLYYLIDLEQNKLTSKEIVQLSQELDLLIKEYYVSYY